MTSPAQIIPPTYRRQPLKSVDHQGPLVELAGRLGAFETTLGLWRKSIDSVADLRSRSKDSNQPSNGQPTSRASRYERRTAHLPHLGADAIGINNSLEGLRSRSRTAHKARPSRRVKK